VSVEVDVHLRVVSSVPGQTGNWSYSKVMELAEVPRAGDSIVLQDGTSVFVKSVSFREGCIEPVYVDLEPTVTDRPDVLDWLRKLHAGKGWSQWGGPWAGQVG
jgi:hypothetical protein